MPRDPERIRPFLQTVEEFWLRYPDLRFGQIVENVVGHRAFYAEEDEFLQKLRAFEHRLKEGLQ